MRRLAVTLALLAVVLPTGALADGHLAQEARDIGKLLKCPVCQNLSVADSPSQLAQQMRDLILERLEGGQSREAILAYFVERYGEEVLLDPPKAGFGQLVWWGALGIPLGGAILLAVMLRGWLRRHDTAAPGVDLSEAESEEYEELLERELRRPGRSGIW